MKMGISLYKHQQDAIKKMRNGCILCGDVGSGKSRTGLAYYFIQQGGKLEPYEKMNNPKRLYIITTARKRDEQEWEGELVPFLLSSSQNEYDFDVFIDSWNNIKKYIEVKDACFIFDEQRVVGSGAWVKAFYKITKSNEWILLTATPGDTWMDYVPVFVANGFYKNKTHFSREHVIYSTYTKFPKVEKFYSTKKLERLRDEISVEMAVPRHTTRHRHQIMCEYNLDVWKKVVRDRWNPFKDEPIENVSELFVCMRRVVNSDP